MEREIGETQRLMGELAHPLKFFRPNGKGRLGPHLLSRDALAFLLEQRFTMVTWNNVPGDWLEPKLAWVDNALAALAKLPWSLLVLHDEHIAQMMPTLADFYARAMEMGAEIVQDFPASCVPIRQGQIVGPIDDLVTPALADAANG